MKYSKVWSLVTALLLWLCPPARSQQLPEVVKDGVRMYAPTQPFFNLQCVGPLCPASGGFTPAGDLSGSSSSQTVTGLQGKPVAATSPTPGQTPTWNGTAYVPATPAIANMPSVATMLADYDFHEGSGTTVSDVSGHGNTMTLTSGTPGGTSAPVWIQNPATGAGVGIGMGSDSLGSYGLPTLGGTSCQTVPVLQNAAQTVLIQYFNPPVGTDGTQSGLVTYPNTFAIQDWLGNSNPSTGMDFFSVNWVNPVVSNNTGGQVMSSVDNMVGFHTDILILEPGGGSIFYHDGQPLPAYTQGPYPYTATATNWILGCNGTVQAGGDTVTAPTFVYRLAFWSNALNSYQVQQAYGYATNNLLISKGFQPQVKPRQLNRNQYAALGDSQTSGANGLGGSTLYPFAFCAVTSNCYGTTYNTTLASFGGEPWIEDNFGLPGAGSGSLPAQVFPGLGNLRGDSNALHVASILIGTNGLSAGLQTPCATIENLKQAGWDVWVQTLFSLSTTAATDQANRDPYTFNEMQSAFQCGATGIIDTTSDAYIGADGTNGTAPPGGVGVAGVHLSPSGYAWLMSINARVLNAYYQANPSIPTVYSASSVTMNGKDRYTTFSTGSNAIAATLPDCIGMVAMPYYFTVSGANAVTLTAASVTGQTETVNGGSSYVMGANSIYKFLATTNATATAAPGGCNWVPAQAPGLVGSASANTVPMFDALGHLVASPITFNGSTTLHADSYSFQLSTSLASQFKNNQSYSTCNSGKGFENYDNSGISGDATYMYLCGAGGAQVSHSDAAHTFMDVPIVPKVYTVSTLPSASTAGAGATVQVSDASSFTPGTCTGGGSDYMIAISNGTSWSCH